MPEYEDWSDGYFSLHSNHTCCPHCGHEWHVDDWYPQDNDTLEADCPKCEKPLLLTAMISVTIFASRAKGEGDE